MFRFHLYTDILQERRREDSTRRNNYRVVTKFHRLAIVQRIDSTGPVADYFLSLE